MSLVTVEQLRESYHGKDKKLAAAVRYAFLGGKAEWNEELVTRKLDAQLKMLLDHDLGKTVRPWQLVNFSAMLDKKQPWVGIEYETGYDNEEDYKKVINYLWRNHELTAVDAEGCGTYPCEITFGPVNFDDFVTKSYHMDRLLKWMADKRIRKAKHRALPMKRNGNWWDDGDKIGLHCNISTPAYRQLTSARGGRADNSPARIICALLNNSVGGMTKQQKIKVFGREPYGLFFRRGDDYTDWLEGKLFNSVGELGKWAKYKEMIAVFCEVIETLSLMAINKELPKLFKMKSGKLVNDQYDYWRSESEKNGWTPYENGDALRITNMFAILSGKAEVGDMVLEHKGEADDDNYGSNRRNKDEPNDMQRVGEGRDYEDDEGECDCDDCQANRDANRDELGSW